MLEVRKALYLDPQDMLKESMFPVLALHNYLVRGAESERFPCHQGPISSLDFNSHPDFNNLFLTSSSDWTIKLWTSRVRCCKNKPFKL